MRARITVRSVVPNGWQGRRSRKGGALLHRGGELLAVVDQFANEVDDAAGRLGMSVPAGIGLCGWGGELEGSGHERNKNTKTTGLSRNILPSLPFAIGRWGCAAAVLRIRWLADFAVHGDAAAMRFRDDVVGDRQAEAGASPVGLVVKNGWNSLS
jgi:hypothetical protein